MTHRSPHRLPAADAERLLEGRGGGGDALSRLLAAAAAPAGPGDLPGLDAVLAAFRAAPVPAPEPARRTRMIKTAIGQLLAAKALAATTAGVALGGVALAAATGSLPGPLQDAAHGLGAPAAQHGTSTAPTDADSPTGAPSDSPHPTASPSPSLDGLCHAWLAGAGSASDRVATNPAFSALVTAARGSSNVDTYCQARLAGARPTDLPSQASGRPSELPTQATGHATQQPSSLPAAPVAPPTSVHPSSSHPGAPGH